jgi:hypothetical protein
MSLLGSRLNYNPIYFDILVEYRTSFKRLLQKRWEFKATKAKEKKDNNDQPTRTANSYSTRKTRHS